MITEAIINQAVATIIGVILTFVVSFIAAKTPQIVAQVILYLKMQVDLLRSKFTSEQLAMFDAIVTQAIRAVEQKVLTKEVSDESEAKKSKAIQMIQSECTRLGISFDVAAADRMIEAGIKQGLEQGMSSIQMSAAPLVIPPNAG